MAGRGVGSAHVCQRAGRVQPRLPGLARHPVHPRGRRIAELLAQGHGTADAAGLTGLSRRPRVASPTGTRRLVVRLPHRFPTTRQSHLFHAFKLASLISGVVSDQGDSMTITLSNLILDRPLAVLDIESTGTNPAARTESWRWPP